MLCDIHCAPLERRDWKDRRAIDISLLWSERHILPRPDKIGIQSNWGYGSGKMPDLQVCVQSCWGFWVFRLDMLCDIHCAPLERRDWKDRRAIDISLLWSERHMLPRPDKIGIQSNWGYGSGKMPDLRVCMQLMKYNA